MDTFARIGLRFEQAKAMTFAGMALAQDENFYDALATFDSAQQLFTVERNRYWTASLDLSRAHVLLRLGRISEAKLLAPAAKRQFEELQVPSKRTNSAGSSRKTTFRCICSRAIRFAVKWKSRSGIRRKRWSSTNAP
jgi:hypothetical protein